MSIPSVRLGLAVLAVVAYASPSGGGDVPSPPSWVYFAITDGLTLDGPAMETEDGGIIVAGVRHGIRRNDDSSPIVLFRFDRSGQVLWSREYELPARISLYGRLLSRLWRLPRSTIPAGAVALVPAPNGGIVIVATADAGAAVVLIEVDRNGRRPRASALEIRDGRSTYGLFPTAAMRSPDGRLHVAGVTATSDAGWFSLPHRAGEVRTRVIAGPGHEHVAGLAPAPDDGVYLAGSTESPGAGVDIFLARLDSAGSVLWQSTYGGTETDEGAGLAVAESGCVVLSGRTTSFGEGGNDVWVVSVDPDGIIQRVCAFGGINEEVVFDSTATADGGLLVTGSTWSFGQGGADYLLLRLTPELKLSWSRTLGHFGTEEPRNVLEMGDGGIFVSGTSQTRGYPRSLLVSLGADGDVSSCDVSLPAPVASRPTLALSAPASLVSREVQVETTRLRVRSRTVPLPVTRACP